jgi:hypothetical protein
MMTSDYKPGPFAKSFDRPPGPEIWAYLNLERTIGKMEAASFLTRPAVEPLAPDLLEEFGSEILQDGYKQMIGHMVRQVMETQGYAIVRRDIRIFGNVVFSTGACYAPAVEAGKVGKSMRITREQREEWRRTTQHGAFNQWFDPQVRNVDGTLDLQKLHEIAAAHGIDSTPYASLNPGQQRMTLGNMIRARRRADRREPS